MKLSEAIALRVSNLLNEKSLKPYFLFKEGGIARSTISNLLSFNINNVSTDLVYQISSTLGVSMEEFFADKLFDEVDD